MLLLPAKRVLQIQACKIQRKSSLRIAITMSQMGTSKELVVSMDHFKGCLLGALLGDCIGGVFEGRENVPLEHYQSFFNSLHDDDFLDDNPELLNYSDDTAMLKSVAESLIHYKGFNAPDLAKRFVSEYYSARNRGYGGNVIDVFAKLKQQKQGADPFTPAREQFNGTGSYGNGGAMRVAPVALFCHGDYGRMLDIARQTTRLTHTHRLAVHGALFQTIAVHQALLADRSKPIDPTLFLSEMRQKMIVVEQNNEPDEEDSYVKQLDVIEHLLGDSNTKDSDVIRCLGNGVAAFESVPTALYVFLRALQPITHLQSDSVVTRAIQYAITLGGDTDTIATMAGAIAGAHYGRTSIEPALVAVVEAAGYIEELAGRLYDVTEKPTVSSDEPER